jgi:hypothetical protein
MLSRQSSAEGKVSLQQPHAITSNAGMQRFKVATRRQQVLQHTTWGS